MTDKFNGFTDKVNSMPQEKPADVPNHGFEFSSVMHPNQFTLAEFSSLLKSAGKASEQTAAALHNIFGTPSIEGGEVDPAGGMYRGGLTDVGNEIEVHSSHNSLNTLDKPVVPTVSVSQDGHNGGMPQYQVQLNPYANFNESHGTHSAPSSGY